MPLSRRAKALCARSARHSHSPARWSEPCTTPFGDMPGRQLLVQLVADCVVHSWDLATAIGVDPGLDEQLIELSYEFYLPLMQKDAVYAYGWFKPPASTLPEGATALERLLHLLGR